MSTHPDDLVSRFAGRHVAVIGDVMLDHFLLGRVLRISPEAPVPVVHFDRDEFRVGGAANVAHNIVTLGGQASLVGVVGDDRAAADLARELGAAGLPTAGLVADPARPTTSKVRVVTMRHQQVARIDYEADVEIAGEVERRILAEIETHAPRATTIVISDYLKGCITRTVVHSAVANAAPGVPVLVDPKIPHIEYYAGTTLVTPNHHEAEVATNTRIRSEAEARAAARQFRTRAQCANVLMTRGDQGMWLLSDESEGHLPSAAREVADVTGAGDTVIAAIAVMLAAGATMSEAARLANEAAGLSVAKFGPATVSLAELLKVVEASATT